MTVIIGIKCDSGVVLAADSGATQGVSMQKNKKLFQVQSDCLVGCSGSEGHAQVIRSIIGDHYQQTSGFSGAKVVNVSFGLAEAVASVLNTNIMRQKDLGVANHSSALIAVPVEDEARLLLLDTTGGFQECTTDYPCTSIGSGSNLALPFLGFLRRILWPDELPSIQTGKLAALWAMQHTLSLSTGFVSGPVLLGVLSLDIALRWHSTLIEGDDFKELTQRIADIETDLREVVARRDDFNLEPVGEIMPQLED